MAPFVPSQQQPSWSESMFLNSKFETPSPPSSRCCVSGPYSSRRDTIYPQQRKSKTQGTSISYLRLYPPSPCMPLNTSRPPLRSSLPADVFDPYMDDTVGDAESDGSSAFSFTIYDIDFGEREIERPLPPTCSSAFSLSSFRTEAWT